MSPHPHVKGEPGLRERHAQLSRERDLLAALPRRGKREERRLAEVETQLVKLNKCMRKGAN